MTVSPWPRLVISGCHRSEGASSKLRGVEKIASVTSTPMLPPIADRSLGSILSTLPHWGDNRIPPQVNDTGCMAPRMLAPLALDVKAILSPPCIFHWWFSIRNIQGGVRMREWLYCPRLGAAARPQSALLRRAAVQAAQPGRPRARLAAGRAAIFLQGALLKIYLEGILYILFI
jgi:hypothetical protein